MKKIIKPGDHFYEPRVYVDYQHRTASQRPTEVAIMREDLEANLARFRSFNLTDEIANLKKTIGALADLEAALVANPSGMWVAACSITKHLTYIRDVYAELHQAVPSKFAIRDKHRRGRETIYMLVFKDKNAASLARIFGVPMDADHAVSIEEAARYRAEEALPWEQP